VKLGGKNEISTSGAIIGILIIIILCLILSLWEPFKVLGRVFALVGGVSIFIFWQIELNTIFRETRSDLPPAKPIWNIFQIGNKIDNEKHKEERNEKEEK
jgi:drug/metabolite transporter superfamily protein YnfA